MECRHVVMSLMCYGKNCITIHTALNKLNNGTITPREVQTALRSTAAFRGALGVQSSVSQAAEPFVARAIFP